LLKRGLAAEGFDVSQPNARSRDYGVVDAGKETGSRIARLALRQGNVDLL
jgi:hypothetical protein